ncbi:MAG: hypothetical protein WB778_00880 [Thermoplasmata archaeon]
MSSFDLAGQRGLGFNGGRRRRWGAALVLAGVILLIASLFVGWWSLEVSGFGITETLVLGFPVPNGGNGVSFECGGNLSQFIQHCPASETYSNASLNATGTLYTAIQFLVFGGVVLGLLGGVLALRTGAVGPRRKLTIVLVTLALALSLAAPAALALAQPAAMHADYPKGTVGSNGTSPTNSFWGTNSTDGIAYDWGASVGWYVALGAFLLILVGLFLISRRPKAQAPGPTRGYGSVLDTPAPETSDELTTSKTGMYRPPPAIDGIDSEESHPD